MNSSNSLLLCFSLLNTTRRRVDTRALLEEHANGLGVRVLAEACGLLRFSCGSPKLSCRHADDPLKVEEI